MKRPRRGVASIWALVVLSVLGLILAATTSQILANRRFLERRQHQIQSAWLAQAGVELAAARLLADPKGYEGESVELIPGSKVHIEVKVEPKTPEIFQVVSEAHYPATGNEMVSRQQTRRFRRVTDKDGIRLEVVAGEAPGKKEKTLPPVKQ